MARSYKRALHCSSSHALLSLHCILSSSPQRFRHRIELGEIQIGAERAAAIQAHMRSVTGQQTAPERILQQADAHQRLLAGTLRRAAAQLRPALLDLADPLGNEAIIAAMRPTVERQAQADGSSAIRWQEQAVAAKIVEPDPFPAKGFEKAAEAALGQQLARQQVMAL